MYRVTEMPNVVSVDFLRRKRIFESADINRTVDEFWSCYLIRLLRHYRVELHPELVLDSRGYFEKDYHVSPYLDLKITRWFEIPPLKPLPLLTNFSDYSELRQRVKEASLNMFHDQVSLCFTGFENNTLDFFFYQNGMADLSIRRDNWAISGIQNMKYLFDAVGDYDPDYVVEGLVDFIRSSAEKRTSEKQSKNRSQLSYA